MTGVLELLIEEECKSYEDFLSGVAYRKPKRGEVTAVIHRLEAVVNGQDQDESQCSRSCGLLRLAGIDEGVKEIWQEIGEAGPARGHIPFLFNICWFYRWLLSEGYPFVYEDGCMEAVRRFIDFMTIPEYVAQKIKWAGVFGRYAVFNEREREGVHERILERYSPARGVNTFADIIDGWLIHHVLLRSRKERGVDAYMEKILWNYISLVDTYPEIEDIFGIAIEKDMEIIYNRIKEEGETRQDEK
jgi:hypothetical protein